MQFNEGRKDSASIWIQIDSRKKEVKAQHEMNGGGDDQDAGESERRMKPAKQPDDDKLYYSHGGRGPNVARVVSIDDGVVWLEIKASEKSKHWKSVTISEKFFNSLNCGWKKRRKAA